MISEQLAMLMKTLLVKRIDSSFHAFIMSLHRYHQANSAMVKMFENNRIYIAPKLNVNEFIHDDNEQELVAILEESDDPNLIRQFTPEDFNLRFLEGLKHDQKVLDQLVSLWAGITTDPKLDTLISKLKGEFFSKDINDNGKLVLFSESKETTNYLYEELKKHGFTKMLAIDSGNMSTYVDTIAENFDANYDLMKQKDDFNIITTEVLAEGVNLHRSNIIVNYDIP